MRLSQSALFQLCCASFLAGVILSFFYDFLYATRLFLMPSKCRYSVLTIQKLRASRIKEGTKARKKGLRAAVFFCDVLFCLASAITLVLLLYWLNNGSLRVAAPLCMSLGFYLCRISISKGIRWGFQWMAFGIETFILALCMPIKRLFITIAAKCQKHAQKRRQKRLSIQRKKYTKQELTSIDKAAQRILPIDSKTRMQKGDNHAAKSKKAV